MKIAVIGVGGVGGYFGGKLALAGEEVVFLARGSHLQEIQRRGLILEYPDGGTDTIQARATQDPAEVGYCDVVIVGVKAWQVAEAAERMKPLIGPHTFVVPLQNGVESPKILSDVLGSGHVLGGLCYLVSMIVGPGRVRHVAMDPFITFGEMDKTDRGRASKLAEAFRKAGVNVTINTDIEAAMWEKFLFIAPLSGLGAVTRAPIGVTRSIPETRSLLETSALEIAAVAAKRSINLNENAVQSVMDKFDSLPTTTTASMQRDIMEGKPSELQAQCGAVVRLAGEVAVPVPVNEFFYKVLLPQEQKARGLAAFSL